MIILISYSIVKIQAENNKIILKKENSNYYSKFQKEKNVIGSKKTFYIFI